MSQLPLPLPLESGCSSFKVGSVALVLPGSGSSCRFQILLILLILIFFRSSSSRYSSPFLLPDGNDSVSAAAPGPLFAAATMAARYMVLCLAPDGVRAIMQVRRLSTSGSLITSTCPTCCTVCPACIRLSHPLRNCPPWIHLGPHSDSLSRTALAHSTSRMSHSAWDLSKRVCCHTLLAACPERSSAFAPSLILCTTMQNRLKV